MALTAEEIRNIITGPPEALSGHAFSALSGIAALDSRGDHTESRELLLRTLERREALGGASPMLNALIREHGLFPYLDDPASLGAADRLAYEVHRPVGIDNIVFHSKQAEVYRLLADGHNVVLSAPTSFGKSLIIDGILGTGKHRAVVLIVPTIALIDETRRRLTRRFHDEYKIVTHPSQSPGDRTLYILTQERFLDLPPEQAASVDFFAIDEFYKLDSQHDERSGLLNQAFHQLHATGAQFYLLGPNIDNLVRNVHERLQFQFVRTDYETVTLDTEFYPATKRDLPERVISRCRTLTGPTLLYARSPRHAREIARWLIDANLGRGDRGLDDAAKWVSDNYHPKWLAARALRNGIGIHHGRMPRALAHHIVRLFNEGRLPWLIVTSTLIEGVNTVAKNVVIVDNKIGTRKFDFFTYSNIRGRSGRMFRHFVGKVIVYGEPPEKRTKTVDVPAYSQGPDAPLSLLIQLPWNELSTASRERLQPYYEQQLVSIGTLRAVPGTDPAVILAIARILHADPRGWSNRLAWTGRPTYSQLLAACELIFQLSGGRHRGGVSSGEQLAKRIDLVRSHRGQIRSLADEQMRFAGARINADDAVEDVLDFIREWPTYKFPRLLMLLQTITEDIFGRYNLPAGDYRHYSGAVKTLFRPPMLNVLEEYGLPAPLTERLQRFVPTDATIGQIDEVLAHLRRMPRITGLSHFEEEMLRDTIDNL
jgi:hypothetical protein